VSATRPRRPFSLGDIKGLNILVTIAAPAIENCRLYGDVKDEEQRYHFLFTNMLEGYARCRVIFERAVAVDFVYLDVNAAFEKLTGLRDVAGKRVAEVIPDIRSSNPELFEIYGRVASSGAPERFETYLPALDSWFSIAVYGAGKDELIAIFDNVTGAKRTEEALRQSEAKHRVLYESSRDAVMTLAPPTWRFTGGNPATWKLFGASDERAFLAFTPWELSPERQPDGRLSVEKAREMIGKAMEEGENYFEWTHRRVDGTDFPATVLLTRVELGGRRFLQATVRDVTKQKRLEEQLLHSQKMEAVGRLAGGVAHDFNNLLSVIITSAGFLADGVPETDPRREEADEILAAGRRAADLARQLLAFSRKQVLQPRVFDLNEALRGLHKMLKRIIGEDIELVTRPADGIWTVMADPGQIEQVIVNLAVNARDAMPDGGKLTIETRNEHLDEEYARTHDSVTPGPHVMLAVSDSGSGMDRATLARIFEPFFTTKAAGKGTGLGLSTVYGIVRQSGGSVFVYSEPGEGTSFKIYLPRLREGATTQEAQDRGPVPSGTETILLVEDDGRVRRAAREILRRGGYWVLEASDPGEALALCEKVPGRIQLLLTDLVMPGMSGRELAEKVVALRPRTRVLYMSGYTDDAVVRHGVLEPGKAFIQKPFTPESLSRKIREVLDGG
jgi:PAS domain S-box-containing protein